MERWCPHQPLAILILWFAIRGLTVLSADETSTLQRLARRLSQIRFWRPIGWHSTFTVGASTPRGGRVATHGDPIGSIEALPTKRKATRIRKRVGGKESCLPDSHHPSTMYPFKHEKRIKVPHKRCLFRCRSWIIWSGSCRSQSVREKKELSQQTNCPYFQDMPKVGTDGFEWGMIAALGIREQSLRLEFHVFTSLRSAKTFLVQ